MSTTRPTSRRLGHGDDGRGRSGSEAAEVARERPARALRRSSARCSRVRNERGIVELEAVDVRRRDRRAVRDGHRPRDPPPTATVVGSTVFVDDEVEQRRAGAGGAAAAAAAAAAVAAAAVAVAVAVVVAAVEVVAVEVEAAEVGGVPFRVFVNVQTTTSPPATAPSTFVPATETRTGRSACTRRSSRSRRGSCPPRQSRSTVPSPMPIRRSRPVVVPLPAGRRRPRR